MAVDILTGELQALDGVQEKQLSDNGTVV